MQATPIKTKAIALMSGGLDSTLAAKIVKDQGVEVVGLHLLSPFGCREDVAKSTDAVGIPLLFKEKGESYLDLVQNPRYGYGKNMNPCIDCRIFMFQLADVVRQDIGAQFIVTGEVLGQRPMSQQRHAMELIDRQSPVEGLIVRPLSAHLFPPSIPEEKGWVDRAQFFDIAGRSRKEQIAMAERFGIKDFSAPGGGCLLTEAAFSRRLKDFYEHPVHQTSEARLAQSALLRLGRHFRLDERTKFVIGRNEIENLEMEKLWRQAGGLFLIPDNFDGPSAVILGDSGETEQRAAGEVIARYGKSAGLDEKRICYESLNGNGKFVVGGDMPEARLDAMRL